MTIRRGWALLACVCVAATFADRAWAEDKVLIEPPSKPVFVSAPVVPTSTPAVRDLPDYKPDPNLFGLEMKRREDYGFIPIEYVIKPKVDPLLDLERLAAPRQPDAFGTPIHNYAGLSSTQSPPDTTGDVGLTYYLQATNQTVSTVIVINKATGAIAKNFTMQSLATSSPCSSGFCDPIVMYDRAADRWFISELPASGGSVCVYVSKTGDPTGAWWAYAFAVETSTTDYPKYGVWPQNGNGGSYLIGVNAGSGGRDLFALDRAKMLAGQPATFQKWTVASLPNSGFQLVLPSDMQGNTPPPNGEPALFIRPHDDEAQNGASTPTFDYLDMWTLSVDWTTPANSVLTQLAPLHIGDYDETLCGLGTTWNCMPQPGTTQKLDPIREPLHFPLHYRNFGDHQTLVGTFAEDVDGTDHSALRWFELRKSGAGAWTLFQEGLVGGEANVHRSVGSIAMDGSGNIALGYSRTGTTAPFYPSIYYKGRLASDTPGTMPQGEYVIQDGTFSKTGNERFGDYSGMSIDPVDDCTFWFTTEYFTSATSCGTRVAAFKFDACGCLTVPPAPAAAASVPQSNRIDLDWNDSSMASIVQYQIFRATASGGPYTQIATVADSSPGVGSGPSYTYHDDTVSGGTRYYYVVKSSDGVSCISPGSVEVNALATGACTLPPTFAGVAAVSSAGAATCTLTVSWAAGASNCGGSLTYSVYRSTTSGFTPGPANRIASGLAGTSYADAVAIVYGTTYYYVVRAVDSVTGVEDANTVEKSGTPYGPSTSSSWVDTFEGAQSGGGFDLAGWTKSSISGSTNWAWSTARFHDGAHSWFAADATSANDKVLVSPSFGVLPATTLSFWHTYAFEGTTSTCYDGGTIEYTTNGGTTWTVVPAADFTAGAYTGTVNTGFSNPIGGKTAWCAGTVGALTQVAVNLGADANLLNKTIQLRWHEGDDSSSAVTGWYVDTVAVNNAGVAGSCVPGTTGDADLAVTKTASPGPVATGDDIAYTVTVTNNGPASATTVQLADATPVNTAFRSITAPAGWICSTPAVGGTGTINCSATTLAVASPASFTIVDRVAYCVGDGSVGNTASVSSANTDPAPANNSATASTTVTDSGACSDGNACTINDACSGATCVPGTPTICDDGNACTTNTCDPATGQCAYPAIACNDGNLCTDDSCNPATGCVYTNNTAPCTDGLLCTTGDACSGGSCVGTPVACSDGNACTTDACDPATGQCTHAYNNGACDDGNACTTNDTCIGPPVCGLSESFDGVTAPALPSGWTSTVTGSGAAWTTVATSSDTAPNSAFAPDGAAVSDEVLLAPPIPVISASATLTFRTRWSFEGATSCFDAGVLEIKIGAGSFTDIVTAGGSFVSGGYTGTVSSAYSNPLAGRAAWCNASTGYPAYVTSVVNLPAAAAGQTIQLRWRVGTDISVAATGQNVDSIAIADACATVCTGGAALNCDDSNACTDDSCSPATGCVHTNNAAACSDGNACTVGDVCGGGVCNPGAATACNDGNPCTDDSCDPATGSCVTANNTASCSDGNACTTGDVCSGGSCQPGTVALDCNDSNPCTDDSCEAATGCVHTDNVAPCSDGNACTTGDACSGGSCQPGTVALDCNDNNPCTDDSCEAAIGCVHADNAAPCNDGNACTTGDACSGGSCHPGSAVPPPGGTTGLIFSTSSALDWNGTPGATGYDVVRGTLSALKSGGFSTAVDLCLAGHLAATSTSDPHVPAAGDADWFLIRAYSPCGAGTYDDGTASLVTSRDSGIGASPSTCP